ncbi:hypothetical protein Vretimale_16681 [Volvox reticuliferus]|uniref:Uncharacterized protein n=1 Tax=Volvox reticuliferus TaxID=1737510 RepID=A0A8J4GRM2_9CHLO|nr:hypothetical protein Vretifemale_8528 [Volvox reticuliferus]GIM13615.1 hypothetical protein Vretimale_16681 [Volvox reticuliferus]
MTTTVARPAHRKQGSDITAGPLPVLGAATSTVTLDGRLLEIQDVQQRGRRDDEGRGSNRVQGSKGAVARPPPLARAPADKAPMTPPRVSGISLAPLPNLEHHSCSGEKSPGASTTVKIQRRPSITHGVLGGKAPPHPAAIVTAGGVVLSAAGTLPAATCVGCGGGGISAAAGGTHGPHQFIAEGRSIVRSVMLDPWITAYMDINGADDESVCATPPRLNMQSLARADTHGAFGPLSPCPLSPSILTVCGQPGHDDRFAFNDSLDLMDMRTCQSPKLPPV